MEGGPNLWPIFIVLGLFGLILLAIVGNAISTALKGRREKKKE